MLLTRHDDLHQQTSEKREVVSSVIQVMLNCHFLQLTATFFDWLPLSQNDTIDMQLMILILLPPPDAKLILCCNTKLKNLMIDGVREELSDAS